MSTATRLLTAEEFFVMPGAKHQELVRGPGELVGIESGFMVDGPEATIESPDLLPGQPQTRGVQSAVDVTHSDTV